MFGWSAIDGFWLLVGLSMAIGTLRAKKLNKELWAVFTAMVLSIPLGRVLQSMSVQDHSHADYIAAFVMSFLVLQALLILAFVFGFGRRGGKKKEGKAKEGGHGGGEHGGGHGGGHGGH